MDIKHSVISLWDVIMRLTRSDLYCVLLLFLVALLLRTPFITHPPVTQFDEVVYVDFSLAMLSEAPFIDIHPPLARMLFTEAARGHVPESTPMLLLSVDQAFEGFPYERVRMLMAFIGTLLPLSVYLTGRALSYPPRVALLIGLFIAIDNAMIIYSRVILPDMLLLLFHFLAIGFAFLSVRNPDNKRRTPYMLLAALFVGCALSIKWTALGIFGLLVLIFIAYRRYSSAIAVATIAPLVYIGIFMLSLVIYFPHGGESRNDFPTPQGVLWDTHIEFPDTADLGEVLRFIPLYSKAMYQMNNDLLVLAQGSVAQAPLSWPFGENYIVFWSSPNRDATIHVTGNRALWVFAFLVFFFNLLWILYCAMRRLPISVSKFEALLIIGYFANYLPFFVLDRPMYLYHYFTALIILVILLPVVAPRLKHTLEAMTKDKVFGFALIVLGVVVIFVDALLLLPTTFGF